MNAGSWRYEAAVSRRDLRLDLLRGLCLAKMVFNHLWKTPLHGLQSWLGFVTAAEGFFLLSGVVTGIVHGRRTEERGLAAAGGSVLQRSFNLYVANLAFVFLFLALEVTGLVPHDFFGYGGRFTWAEPFHLNQPYYLQVLPRYVVFLALTPLALWCLTTGRTVWMLAVSAGLWLANLVSIGLHGGGYGGMLLVPGLEPPRQASFPLVAWQLLFFVGMAIGHHRRCLAAWWGRLPVPTVGAALLALCVLAALYRNGGLGLPALPPALDRMLLDRRVLGPARLVNFAAFSTVLFWLTDRLWRPMTRVAGPALIPFGQASLYLFLVHIPVVWISRSGVPALTALSPHWSLVLVDGAILTLLWWAIRRRFLFDFVPR